LQLEALGQVGIPTVRVHRAKDVGHEAVGWQGGEHLEAVCLLDVFFAPIQIDHHEVGVRLLDDVSKQGSFLCLTPFGLLGASGHCKSSIIIVDHLEDVEEEAVH